MLASTAQLVCSLPARHQFRVFLCSAFGMDAKQKQGKQKSTVLSCPLRHCFSMHNSDHHDHYGRYMEPSLAAYLALPQGHGAGGPATLLSKHNRFSASQLDSSSSCFAYLARGRALCKQRLSHWITEALSPAYSTKGLASPQGIGAHSTRANS